MLSQPGRRSRVFSATFITTHTSGGVYSHPPESNLLMSAARKSSVLDVDDELQKIRLREQSCWTFFFMLPKKNCLAGACLNTYEYVRLCASVVTRTSTTTMSVYEFISTIFFALLCIKKHFPWMHTTAINVYTYTTTLLANCVYSGFDNRTCLFIFYIPTLIVTFTCYKKHVAWISSYFFAYK